VIVDRVGMSIATTDWIMGANRRPTAERGVFATWHTGADVVNVDAFRLLRL